VSDSVRFGETFAILDDLGQVVCCGEDRYQTWMFFKNGEKKSVLRIDPVGLRVVETIFRGVSRALDGPHKFFQVSLTGYVPTKSRILAFPDSGKYLPIGTPRFEDLDQALAADPPFWWSALYTSKEEALKEHAQILKRLKAKARKAVSTARAKLYEEFLIRLAIWCKGERGRQTDLAKEVGTTPQRVNDWLALRKTMSAEQVLRVQVILGKKEKGGG
jgi:hypothetical protein